MSDEGEEDLRALVKASANLPGFVKAGLIKALSDLLGGLISFPAELVRRPAQAQADITAGRSAVSALLAKGVADAAMNDPATMQAAAEIYLPSVIRKARNRARIAQKAVESAVEMEETQVAGEPPEDDWMNAFVRFAEDASSEKLQDLFGRILAGQVARPGSFSLATLRVVAELDKSIAEDFSRMWERSVGEAVDYSAELRRGEWFSRWRRLAENGLMSPSEVAQYLPEFSPVSGNMAIWTPAAVKNTFLTVWFSQACVAKWVHVEFTRTGRQLGSILAPPDYAKNMREVGQQLAKQGVEKVMLQVAAKPPEIIFSR